MLPSSMDSGTYRVLGKFFKPIYSQTYSATHIPLVHSGPPYLLSVPYQLVLDVYPIIAHLNKMCESYKRCIDFVSILTLKDSYNPGNDCTVHRVLEADDKWLNNILLIHPEHQIRCCKADRRSSLKWNDCFMTVCNTYWAGDSIKALHGKRYDIDKYTI